jgi:hypothetical protein
MLQRSLFTLLLFTICGQLSAQNSLPFGPTNAGQDFWVSFPSNWEYQATQKYIRLYITSPVRTRVAVYSGSTLLDTLYTIPYDIVTVDLPQNIAQAIVRDDAAPIPNDQVYVNKAVHVVADDPVVVYGMNRSNYTSDGMLMLPVSSLGQEYVVASASDVADGISQKLPSQYLVIAPYDTTTVTITNPWDTPNHQAGSSFTITMNSGDVFSSMSTGFGGDLSGAWISADKPVAVAAGQNCTYLPNRNYPACDHLEEMLFPVSAWGELYRSVPYATRKKGDLFRIFAGADNAKVYINGILYATLPKKGGVMGSGFVEFLPPERGLFEFSSDKPIMVVQYNNSQQYDGVQSDPFYAVLVPVEQYQKEIVFTTPSGDFPQNYVNLVCDSATLFQIEIAVGGTSNWTKLTATYGADFKTFPTKVNGMTYIGKTFMINPGTYRMRGPDPFTGTIYGYGSYDSYGYPLAASVANISVDDSSNSIISRNVDCNGDVIAAVQDMPEASSLRTNISAVTLDPVASSNYTIEVNPFIPGRDRSATYTMRVLDRTKDAIGVIVASDMHGNITRDTVRYAATGIAPDQTFVDFGSWDFQPVTHTVSLVNNSTSEFAGDSLTLQHGESFRIVEPTAPFTIPPDGSLQVKITFTPSKFELSVDSLGVVSKCGTQWVTELRGRTAIDTAVDDPTPSEVPSTVSPNPISNNAVMNYSITIRSSVQATLFDADGREVRTLLSLQSVEAGEHTARLDLSGLPAGTYFVHVTAGEKTSVHPIVLVK